MAKRKIEWTVESKENLKAILEFYKRRNGNRIYSNGLLKQIKHTISLIQRNNFIGRVTDHTNVRVINKSNYAIFYELKEKNIEIQLIWDSRRDPEDM